jgi:NRAMP (natural resistance-associated macrophage protein)-like metal ion transporter
MFQKIKNFFKVLGPGWITGASDDDPSGIGTYSYSGARFGFAQVWTLLFTLPLMVAIQEMCARIGQVTGRGLAGVMRQHYSPQMLYGMVAVLLFANTINIAANIGAMAASFRLIVDIPFIVAALLFTACTLFLEIFVPYHVYAKFLKFLTLSLFAYVVTAFAVTAHWTDVLHNLVIPTIQLNREFIFLIVAILGTTISPYLFFWQASTEVEEEVKKGRTTIRERKGATPLEIKAMRTDVFFGMMFSNVIAFFIVITAASTLFPNGIVINSAQDAAQALVPIAGPFASYLFAIGIIGTGLLSIPVLAGSISYATSEAFRWKSGLYRKWHEAHGFYGIITIATIIGLSINFIGIDPVRLLLWTAVINGITSPILLTCILRIGNNKKIMGKWTNGRLSNVLGYTTFLVMSLAAILLFGSWIV